jgi:hypothetical protein
VAEDNGRPGRIRKIMKHLQKGAFPEARKEIDDGLYENIVEPSIKDGKPSALNTAVAAGLGAAADFALPEDSSAAGMAGVLPPFKMVGKGLKAGRGLGKITRKANPGAAKGLSKAERRKLTDEANAIRMKARSRAVRTPEDQKRLDQIQQMLESTETLSYSN